MAWTSMLAITSSTRGFEVSSLLGRRSNKPALSLPGLLRIPHFPSGAYRFAFGRPTTSICSIEPSASLMCARSFYPSWPWDAGEGFATLRMTVGNGRDPREEQSGRPSMMDTVSRRHQEMFAYFLTAHSTVAPTEPAGLYKRLLTRHRASLRLREHPQSRA